MYYHNKEIERDKTSYNRMDVSMESRNKTIVIQMITYFRIQAQIKNF